MAIDLCTEATAPIRVSGASGSRLETGLKRVLVAIANHGQKNRGYLDQLVAEYRSMTRYHVDMVVLSDIPKDLGANVEVRVGLPAADPWSLPFGYKKLFEERADAYDLYIYSEDDTLLKESNLDAFVEASELLPEGYIAGFLRYEVAPDGSKYYSSMHSHYHWDPRSVMRVGDAVFAYYTNEHAACFVLTRQQLQKAIASGGFLLPPRRGRYDMLVTAATDPYTECGMKKLICISRFDQFCLHHLPNAYCGKLGLHEAYGRMEIHSLMEMAGKGATLATGPLFEPACLPDGDRWNKRYHEARRDDVLQAMPPRIQSVLSIGCGSGETEEALVAMGMQVLAIPLDHVIGQIARSKGIRILPADFDAAERQLAGHRFDCILMLDILQHLPDPVAFLHRYQSFLRPNGCLLLTVPNWNYHGTVLERVRQSNGQEAPRGADEPRVHRTTSRKVRAWLKQSRFKQIDHCSSASHRWEPLRRWLGGWWGDLAMPEPRVPCVRNGTCRQVMPGKCGTSS